MVTYPRTDARVLSTAVAKEISKNIRGLSNFAPVGSFAQEILSQDAWKTIAKTRYTNDKQITDHYAIIPTGQGLGAYERLSGVAKGVYEVICRRFLSIFYGPAVYKKYALEFQVKTEHFFTSYRMLEDPGYLKVTGVPQESTAQKEGEEEFAVDETSFLSRILSGLKKGMLFEETSYAVKEGETSPPKRYNSGSLILAMENAGQLIEDDELRAQIKGSGIGTSATRAEILKKLVSNGYLSLNAKTQIIKPQKLGEAIYEVVAVSIRQLLNPELTASWEKGLTYVSEGTITSQEYMDKLQNFVARRTQGVKQVTNPGAIRGNFAGFEAFYETSRKS
jgi:DNA topoisomerase-3